MKTIPNRSKSATKYSLILVMYTLILTMIFIQWSAGGVGLFSLAFFIGCVIGVMRETKLRREWKRQQIDQVA